METPSTAVLIYCRHHWKRGINEALLQSCVETTLSPHAVDNPTAGKMHAELNRKSENATSLCSCSAKVHYSISNDETQRSIVAFGFDQLFFFLRKQKCKFHVHSDVNVDTHCWSFFFLLHSSPNIATMHPSYFQWKWQICLTPFSYREAITERACWLS